ncbi:Vacuolar protein sorting-associated protein 51 [Asimina triloba]
MAVDDVPLDDKARRMRDLLSSFYSPDPSATASASGKFVSLDAINSPSFDPDLYMNFLVQKLNLEGLLQKHVEMAAEIKNLDTDLQMLVYENYNKFISATETMKRMKNNIVGMETNMEQLLDKIISVQSKSDGVNTSLFERRENIEKLHRTRNLLRKLQRRELEFKGHVQFIYDLPTQLGKCIKSEAYADAVRFYTGAMPIFEAYGESSFQDCKRASEEAMGIIINNLQAKLYSDFEPVAARADAVVLLRQLNFPVDSLKTKLLEKLEHFLSELDPESREVEPTVYNLDESSKAGGFSDSAASLASESCANQVSIGDFAESVRAYRIIFPDSETQLIELARALFTKRFETVHQRAKKKISSADLLVLLRGIWTDVALMDEVLPEAALPTFSLQVFLVSSY